MSRDRSAVWLSTLMMESLRLLLVHGCMDAFVHGGVCCYSDSGQPAIGFRTAQALTRRGMVRLEHDRYDDYGNVWLTDEGRYVAEQLFPRAEAAPCDACSPAADVLSASDFRSDVGGVK